MIKGKKIVYRAGMIPYLIEDGEVLMMFMKPSETQYGGDQFQLCKGVVEDDDLDTRTAALREGAEELGLRSENIQSVTELGNFLGRTTVFIARVADQTNFDKPHYETDEVTWLTCDQFLKVGRDLHKDIVQLAEQVIRKEEELD
jgi:8-oxo-dGTP pyrophosphatase MutT (NUDIX family)